VPDGHKRNLVARGSGAEPMMRQGGPEMKLSGDHR